jgi:glutaminyl-peptide cyclotransferase
VKNISKLKIMRSFKISIILLSICLFFINCNKKESNENTIKKENDLISNDYKILNVYQHSTNSFIEGLFVDQGTIYESTGSPEELPNTKSVFGILDTKTGQINVKSELDKKIFFGEGIAKCNNKIYQLTYKNKTGFLYDSKTYKQIGVFQFDNNEGWGLTNIKNESLIMSDGTNVLTFLDPKSLKSTKKLEVLENNMPVLNLNELEYVDGYIYANIYGTNKIVKIDAKNGIVVRTIDCTALANDSKSKFSGCLEMNGIAYNNKTNTFLITGKLWPCVYEIKLTQN